MNKVVLIGRLTKDPELKFTPGTGTAVAIFTLAVDRRVKKEGQPGADFIPVIVWGKIGENSATYLKKGSLAGISGRIQTRSYDGQDGQRRYVTEIVAEEVQFLERNGDGKKASEQSLYNSDPGAGNNRGNVGRGENFNSLYSGHDYEEFTPIEDDGSEGIPF